MSQHRQKEVDTIKASEAKEFNKLDRINDLEKQLEEARKFEKRIKHHCQAYEDTGYAWFNMNRIYKEVEQLKEKGDE